MFHSDYCSSATQFIARQALSSIVLRLSTTANGILLITPIKAEEFLRRGSYSEPSVSNSFSYSAKRGRPVLYHILCHDKPGSLQTRLDNREAHLAVVRAIGDRLFAAGPLLNADDEMIGSVLIIDFDSDAAAETFCKQDPYSQAGLFEQVTVTRWRKTLPA
jgi:uncharacterized protein YciI